MEIASRISVARNVRIARKAAKALGTSLLLLGLAGLACGDDDDSSGTANESLPPGGDFAQGAREMPGQVPADGNAPEAPKITSVASERAEIKPGESMPVEIGFTDAQGDLAQINIGVAGEDHYFAVPSTAPAGTSAGTTAVEIKPRTTEPGFYTLDISLTDAAGNVSGLSGMPFIILQADGSRPSAPATHGEAG